MSTPKLRIIPLGGLGEIGRNMTVFEYGDDIVVVDVGLMFPEEEMLGIDLVIPDISYLREHRDRVRGIVLTHGHEDHIGGMPYILRDLNVPVYGTRLTIGLVSVKLREHHLLNDAELHSVEAGDTIELGALRIEFLHVCHSIPDSCALAIHTPVGTVVHTGDFKFDHTPVDGRLTDFARLAELGAEGVLVLLADSTYVEEPGYTPSEAVINETFNRLMADAPGRVIVATFASLISRIQQVADAAYAYGRKLAFVGRSMLQNVQTSIELGYLDLPPGLVLKIEEINRLPHSQVVIMTTGSQGEPTSALTRIANKDHRQIRIVPGDTVVMSATPIPGNEELINRTIDNLFRQGADVLYSKLARVHVHGHGAQEELKLMISLTRPEYFVPIHGEYRHLRQHARLAQALGIPTENTFIVEDGDVLEFTATSGHQVSKVPAGYVYVDGLTVGTVESVVLRDRWHLANDGVMVVIIAMDKQTGKVNGRPDLISRGFRAGDESDDLLEHAREIVVNALNHGPDHITELGFVHGKVKDALSKYLYDQTKSRPMILPVVVEV